MAEDTNLSPERIEQAGTSAGVSVIPEEGEFRVEEAVGKVEQGIKTADQIDETLTRVKEDRGQRQQQAAKQAQKGSTGAAGDDETQTKVVKKTNRYFAQSLRHVTRLTRGDMKQATLLLRSLRLEWRESKASKKKAAL